MSDLGEADLAKCCQDGFFILALRLPRNVKAPRSARARGDSPDTSFDRVFEAIGWTIEVIEKSTSVHTKGMSVGSAWLSISFGLFCAIAALLLIAVVVESCKAKLGIEHRGSGNVDMELIKERAHEQAWLDQMRRSGDIPFECKRYAP